MNSDNAKISSTPLDSRLLQIKNIFLPQNSMENGSKSPNSIELPPCNQKEEMKASPNSIISSFRMQEEIAPGQILHYEIIPLEVKILNSVVHVEKIKNLADQYSDEIKQELLTKDCIAYRPKLELEMGMAGDLADLEFWSLPKAQDMDAVMYFYLEWVTGIPARLNDHPVRQYFPRTVQVILEKSEQCQPLAKLLRLIPQIITKYETLVDPREEICLRYLDFSECHHMQFMIKPSAYPVIEWLELTPEYMIQQGDTIAPIFPIKCNSKEQELFQDS